MANEQRTLGDGEITVDDFGITEVFAAHLSISLANMHPEQAFEAAQHAVRAYVKSYDFVPISHKGMQIPRYQMFPKKSGGEAMR